MKNKYIVGQEVNLALLRQPVSLKTKKRAGKNKVSSKRNALIASGELGNGSAKSTYLVGIDEVGRGCLAGPITTTALAIPRNFRKQLKDSKKLTAKQREEWLRHIKNHPCIIYAVTNVYTNVIDKINIAKAANLAATRAIKKLCLMLNPRKIKNVYLDGGLYLNKLPSTIEHFRPRTVIKGDEKYNSIKLASIVAKVTRDRVMLRNHKKFPVYGFDQHKGYGTKIHIQALKRYGPSKIHRLTFIEKPTKL